MLTCDHIDSRNDVGLFGDKQALIIKGLYSNLRDVHPTKTKHVIDTEWSIADFVGDRSAKKSFHHTMHSNQEEAIRIASKSLKIKSEFSQPGIPHNNSIIERSVGDLPEGSRSLLNTVWATHIVLAMGCQMLLLPREHRCRRCRWHALVC